MRPGEVVNVGFLQVTRQREEFVILGPYTLYARLAVMDWPLPVLERYRQQRPHLYAQMRTRLMAVNKDFL